MRFSGSVIVLDIEGTTSSVSFVYDEMFPLVLRELDAFLDENAQQDDVIAACQQIASDAGQDSLSAWAGGDLTTKETQTVVAAEVRRLMADDVKATGLKQLQGLIWKSAFESGQLKAHLYEEVAPALQRWHTAGKTLRIYSSGSVQAQKLFFGHTIAGDLLSLISGHNDTKTGGKRDAESYRAIADEAGTSASEMLFLSDVREELDAARSAGYVTALVVRPGNKPVADGHSHPVIRSFDEIELD